MQKKLLKTIPVTSSFTLILLATLNSASAHASIPSKLLKKVDQCSLVKSDRTVYFIKQWHAIPSVNTLDIEGSKKLPQSANQTEIFTAINELIINKQINTAIAEGCEGEIDSKFKESFNGWSFESLSKAVADKKFPIILTNVLLKSEVKHGDALKTLCGDDLTQIKYAQLALSDIRGDIGYWQRIVENEKNPAKLKIYQDGVIEMLKLPSTSDAATVLTALKKDVVVSFSRFNDANMERDAALVRAIKKADSTKPILVVYGGLHTEDLKAKFQAEKWNCEIYEPKSYQNNEEKLLDDFKKITQ